MQEDYPTAAKIHSRCRLVFLGSFISALSLYSFQLHPYLKSSFIVPSLFSFFTGFLNQLLIRRRTRFKLDTNTIIVLETNALKTHV